jgi:hypothetical protein
MSQEAKDRLAVLRKVRRTLTDLGEEPVPYSGWSKNIGFSTPFPADEAAGDTGYTSSYYESETSSDDGSSDEPPSDGGGDTTPTLPPPSEIKTLEQSTKSSKATPRPDLHKEFYGDGSSRSTRVQAMQWIPTRVQEPLTLDPESSEYANAMLYGFDANTASTVYGDILVAFARPSNNQAPQALYVFKDNPESNWGMVSTSTSVGRAVNLLNGGTPYVDSDASRYKDIHKYTIDDETGAPWAMWIFDDVWGLRENNAPLTYRREEERKAAVKAPVKRRFD